ncbi:Homeobox-leucine zipper protein HOX14 [Cytospora mali]|uniref:Homeobox-leucine zipper protein HOX14 n=1 Tax=Cytospora mali TaxID=578113 RepID=A0A194V929_CYTMA|nr:Homeobox-leucine zipper protein HOX14 [Valsa mali var. pyri (nom. inval.)]
MEGNNYPQSFNGQTNRNYALQTSSIMDPTQQQHCLDTMAAIHHFQTPVTMWHQSQAQQPGLNAMSMMAQAPNHHLNPAVYPMMLQSQGQRNYQAPMRMFHQALQQAQGSQLYHATIACSKRFSEEEKQKLEKVFTDETQKPSTNRKRGLAEELGCPVPKVNNWFQNRRAREKQLHRVQAYEASQAADSAVSEAEVVDLQEEEVDSVESSEFYTLSHHSQPLQPSSAPFSDADDSSECHAPSSGSGNGQDSENSGTESPERSPVEAQTRSHENDGVGQVLEAGYQSLHQAQILPPNQTSIFSDSNIPMIATRLGDQQGVLSPSPDTYASYQDQSHFNSLRDPFSSSYATDELHGLPTFNAEVKRSDSFASSTSFMTPSTENYSMDTMGHGHAEDDSRRRQSEASGFSSFDTLSPDMLPQDSPSPHQPGLAHDQPSPNPSIASRRKIRPPQRLNQTALRNYPNGPKTGIEGPRRPEMHGTMRRAASANGPLSGKIFKSCPPVSPLSPRSFDPNLLEQFAKASSLTSTTNAFRDKSDASPVRSNFEQQYLSADAPRVNIQRSSISASSIGENAAVSPSTSDFAQELALSGAPTQTFQSFQHPGFTLDTSYGPSPDEPLTTPGLSQFGSEVEFPMSLSAPKYVESEPATPSYVPGAIRGTSVMQLQTFPAFKLDSPPQGDIFPWSRSPDQQLPMWKSSLGQLSENHSQSFQFQPNITPQNFNSPGRG